MNKKSLIKALCVIFICAAVFSSTSAKEIYAGIRCSEYGFWPQPTTSWLGNAVKSMASRFDATPCVVWIVDTWDDWTNEEFLDYFDNNGIKVILQVEPMDENVVTLIDRYLNKYKHHPSVIGFGIDIEWYTTWSGDLGKKVSDNEAKQWRGRIKVHNPDYFLMLKHFFPDWLPPTERDDIFFLDDSQQFPSFHLFINETDPTTKWNIGYRVWADYVKPAMAGMQYGYDDSDGGPSDKLWWSKLDDPQKEIGDSCLTAGDNTQFLFWVDFTAQEFDWQMWVDNKTKPASHVSPMKLFVHNSKINIQHPDLHDSKTVKVTLFDLHGKLLQSESYSNVTSGIKMNVDNSVAKGIYLVKIALDNQVLSSKISIH
jgi:hypothetical protein